MLISDIHSSEKSKPVEYALDVHKDGKMKGRPILFGNLRMYFIANKDIPADALSCITLSRPVWEDSRSNPCFDEMCSAYNEWLRERSDLTITTLGNYGKELFFHKCFNRLLTWLKQRLEKKKCNHLRALTFSWRGHFSHSRRTKIVTWTLSCIISNEKHFFRYDITQLEEGIEKIKFSFDERVNWKKEGVESVFWNDEGSFFHSRRQNTPSNLKSGV